MTVEELANDLLANPDYSLRPICGDGKEHFLDTLPAILLLGLVKVKVIYSNYRKTVLATPDEMRQVLLLMQAKQQAKASLKNIEPPTAVRVAISGPRRLRSRADKLFPLVADLAAFGERRLAAQRNIGAATIEQAREYCARHGLKLAD